MASKLSKSPWQPARSADTVKLPPKTPLAARAAKAKAKGATAKPVKAVPVKAVAVKAAPVKTYVKRKSIGRFY